ncbi:hypothetical protein GF367_04765 [Candidatus Woesearchaeota archaeon]|nr:hypothetical protein [Candidatus Woesearchaeota archaeon]
MVGVAQQSFLVDTKWLSKVVALAEPSRHEVFFIVGGGDGLVASTLGKAARIVTVEPDESVANYLYSLELFRNMVIHAEPRLVLADIPFDKLVCLQPEHLHEGFLSSLLRVPFSQAVMVMPDELLKSFRTRDMLGTLLRAAYDVDVVQSVPKNAFCPALPCASSLVSVVPTGRRDPVAASLRLLMQEAGTMRGLLTRSCREFFDYTLVDAQEAVRMLPAALLKKRFWELSEDEFKEVHDWLKLG